MIYGTSGYDGKSQELKNYEPQRSQRIYAEDTKDACINKFSPTFAVRILNFTG